MDMFIFNIKEEIVEKNIALENALAILSR